MLQSTLQYAGQPEHTEHSRSQCRQCQGLGKPGVDNSALYRDKFSSLDVLKTVLFSRHRIKNLCSIAGKFCGESVASSVLIGSRSVRLQFVSDATDYAAGFNLTYKALKPNYLPGKNLFFVTHFSGRLEVEAP